MRRIPVVKLLGCQEGLLVEKTLHCRRPDRVVLCASKWAYLTITYGFEDTVFLAHDMDVYSVKSTGCSGVPYMNLKDTCV